ncbi:MAG: YjbH domain-containing protein [Candidatus Aegiribacteria sp.]|nr:YjbH domain-containing protein [Candidatus Aegiribacteria sp.]
MKTVRVLSLVILFTATYSVFAGSLPFSRSGLIDTPTASILHHTQVKLGGAVTAFSYQNADSTTESDFALGGYLEFGLFERAQLGVTWLGNAGISGNVQVLAIRETTTIPAIAVGCQNIIGEENYEFFRDTEDSLYRYEESQSFSAYLVLTKNLDYFSGIPICINLGYGIGRFRQGENSDSDGISNPFRGLFGGFDYNPTRNVSLMVEWDGRDANLGAAFTMNDNVRFLGAVAEFEQLALSNRDLSDVMQNVKFSLGVEITLGPFLNATTLESYSELTQREADDLLRKLEEIRSHAREDIEELKHDIP